MSEFVDRLKKGKTFATQDSKQISNLPVDSIKPDPSQVRKHFDNEKLEELAESIKSKGLQNPIHVRHSDEKEDEWIIITGERRWKAVQIADMTHIQAICHPESMNDQEIRTLQMIENLQREDLNVVEMIQGFQSMSELGMRQKDISEATGILPGTISKIFKISNKLPADWMAAIESICSQGDDVPLGKLYEIAKEKHNKKRKSLYADLLEELGYDSDTQNDNDEDPEETEVEEKKSKRERFDPDQVWECLKKIAKKDREEILKYIPTNKLEKLFKEYGV